MQVHEKTEGQLFKNTFHMINHNVPNFSQVFDGF